MFREYPDIMTIPQVAEALRIGKKAAYALVNDHKLGYVRVGRCYKIPKKMLEEYVIATARMNIKL